MAVQVVSNRDQSVPFNIGELTKILLVVSTFRDRLRSPEAQPGVVQVVGKPWEHIRQVEALPSAREAYHKDVRCPWNYDRGYIPLKTVNEHLSLGIVDGKFCIAKTMYDLPVSPETQWQFARFLVPRDYVSIQTAGNTAATIKSQIEELCGIDPSLSTVRFHGPEVTKWATLFRRR